ncbi:MAG: Lpg1974 family pore-forming outer membrane protein [Chlamydiae bacterium]|nr:Lpg1974 family pore-forming outer membrane protein [Chlamydiota bacterium]
MSIFNKSVPFLMLAPLCLLADSKSQATDKTAPMPAGYNSPDRLDLQITRAQTYFTGNFTYWQASQDNMELGVVSDATDPAYLVNGKFINMDFDYQPGFQVGLGVNFLPDNWDVFLEYTWFRGTSHKGTSIPVSDVRETLFPTWQAASFTNTEYLGASESWELHMDFIDAELGRSYFVGKCLTYRPFIGLRAPFIRQEASVDYLRNTGSPTLNTYVNQSAHSWGIGPRLGIALDWLLGKGFNLTGNGAADITYTQYSKLSFKQESRDSGVIVNGFGLLFDQKNVNVVRTHLDLALGLNWGTYFASKKAHMTLSADYGFQVFFDQNMFRTFIDSGSYAKSISPNGNLYVQGLTAALRFDF